MTEKVFAREEWIKALEGLKDTYRLFVPVKDGDYHSFKAMGNGEPNFDFVNTRLSPKSVIYPQAEGMFEYSLDESDPEVNVAKELPKDYPSQAIVGIRPCDMQAFLIVKPNFDNPEYRDPWWVRRFKSTTFVGYGCTEPYDTCFCTEVGGGPFNEKGLDAIIYPVKEMYLVKALTEKGEAFLGKAEGGKPADDSIKKEADAIAAEAKGKIKAKFPTDNLSKKTINELFDAPFWEDLAFACINCGICTYLCPTCWCFDIQDEITGNMGDRIRNWDSCMFPLFTLHGSGHNPRDNKFQRMRQRFMHKLKYYVDKYNDGVQCSGCGRCIRQCPVNIDIRHVCELMNNL